MRRAFLRALAGYGLHRCSLSQDGRLWVGLPPQAEYGRGAAEAVPEKLKAVCFVEAPEQADLVAAFAASPQCRSVELLMIGRSHDYRPAPGSGPLDFARAADRLCREAD